MIKDNRDASRGDIDSNAIPHDQGVGIVHLETVAVHEGHGEWFEWNLSSECAQSVVKVRRFHWVISKAGSQEVLRESYQNLLIAGTLFWARGGGSDLAERGRRG